MTLPSFTPYITPGIIGDNPVTVIDCIGANLTAVNPPAGTRMAGYVTGSAGVPWTDTQLAAHPGAIRIDQSPVDTPADETADVYDMETQAGTLAGLPAWVHGAWAAYTAGKRPGQRTPTVYCSQLNATPVANTLLAAGITNGVNLWIAKQTDQLTAEHLLATANGPFPIVGVQYAFQALFDVSLFSLKWLETVSTAAALPKPQPGTQTGWNYCGKCMGLFYGPGVAQSVCPAGGRHDGEHSHSYELGFSW